MNKKKRLIKLFIYLFIYLALPYVMKYIITYVVPYGVLNYGIISSETTVGLLYYLIIILFRVGIIVSVILLVVGLFKILFNKPIKKVFLKTLKIFSYIYISLFFAIYVLIGNTKYTNIIIPKPVLYLYPKVETNISVKVEKPELLITTYPKYNDGWNVKVESDGDMHDKDNKYYYGLYWIEKKITNENFETGFYVEKEDAINFLEEKLSYIGLNDRERNEFIMYWLPILEDNKKSIINFDLTEEIENTNKLIIEPKPDSLLRVHMNVKKVNKKINIKEQELKSFNRTGYSAVEWGGSIIN